MVMQEIQKGASARNRMNWMALGEKNPRYTCPGGTREGHGGGSSMAVTAGPRVGGRGLSSEQPHLNVYSTADTSDGFHGTNHRAAVIRKVADDGHH